MNPRLLSGLSAALLAFGLLLSGTVEAGTITTLAGGGNGDGGPATIATLDGPAGLAVDAAGNVFVSDVGRSRIRRIDAATSRIDTIAGTGQNWGSGDGGPAVAATLSNPIGVALDPAGNLYIADNTNYRVRKVNAATGIIETVAGIGEWGFSGDGGPATSARMAQAWSIAVDAAGNVFVGDVNYMRVRRIDAATGVIQTVAGNGGFAAYGDGGLAVNAAIGVPNGIGLDGAGNLFIADDFNSRVRRVDAATGIITTVAGNGVGGFGGDGGPATAASLSQPSAVVADAGGNLFIADWGNNRVRRVDAATGVITTVAGNGSEVFSGDGGAATSAGIWAPTGLALDGEGNLLISDAGGKRVRRVEAATGTISTIAGNGDGDGGPAAAAILYPSRVAVDSRGNLYISESGKGRIRKVDSATGSIQALAGNGVPGFSGDGGPAVQAQLNGASNVAIDSAGNVYIADLNNGRIRKVDALTGIISTVAGGGTSGGFDGEGVPAVGSSIVGAQSVAVDPAGNIFYADQFNYRIRRVDVVTGLVATIVGTGSYGYSGDGGPGTSAAFTEAVSLALDRSGNLYFADRVNDRIRKWNATTGIVSTVAATGSLSSGCSVGPATSQSVILPDAVAVDRVGNLFVTGSINHCVAKISGSTGTLSVVAGNGIQGFSGRRGRGERKRASTIRWESRSMRPATCTSSIPRTTASGRSLALPTRRQVPGAISTSAGSRTSRGPTPTVEPRCG